MQGFAVLRSKLRIALLALIIGLNASFCFAETSKVTEQDLSAQKELFQTKLDAIKESLQKDILAKDKETENLKLRLDKQDGRISDIGLNVSMFGIGFAAFLTIALAVLVLLGYLSVKKMVKDQAETWFKENDKSLH
jgi:uncharacterized membrane protein YphA (DoxX/SURF4 family)